MKKGIFSTKLFSFITEKNISVMIAVNFSILAVQLAYTLTHYRFLNSEIPLWFTRPWGSLQLASKDLIFVIPFVSFSIIFLSIALIAFLYKEKMKDAVTTTLTFMTVSSTFLFLSIIRVIEKASSPYLPIISPKFIELLPFIFFAFILCVLIVPLVIKLAHRFEMVTDPARDTHPGMILKQPSARGGALAFYLSFILIALVFIPLNRETVGLYIGTLITTLIGLTDDKRNLNPYARLFLMACAIIVTLVLTNLHIFYFANPFNGTTIRLDAFSIPLNFNDLKFTFLPLADIFTTLWILWFMNMLSWSNAVDGQFSGMVAITCVITSMLALRLLKIDPEQIYVAKLAAIAAGASLGILPYNWHPSKIMWGFGATTMGLLIPILSIMAGTKVAVATLVLIVPVLDALITILRRILQKKSPVWGDRGHLHHRLLDMGWSQQKVAILYWILTAILGAVALFSSGSSKILAVLTIGGAVAFMLVVVNLKGELGKLKSQQSEK